MHPAWCLCNQGVVAIIMLIIIIIIIIKVLYSTPSATATQSASQMLHKYILILHKYSVQKCNFLRLMQKGLTCCRFLAATSFMNSNLCKDALWVNGLSTKFCQVILIGVGVGVGGGSGRGGGLNLCTAVQLQGPWCLHCCFLKPFWAQSI